MKPIRFMGLGFQSVDKVTNKPYEYYTPNSSSADVRHISNDHMIKAYSGYLKYFNTGSVVESIYAHFWDTKSKISEKDISYKYGFDLNGKILNINEVYHIVLK
jgi:hypothetical protein